MSHSTYNNIIFENNAIEYQINETNLQHSTDGSKLIYLNKSVKLINNVNNIFVILYFGFFFYFYCHFIFQQKLEYLL